LWACGDTRAVPRLGSSRIVLNTERVGGVQVFMVTRFRFVFVIGLALLILAPPEAEASHYRFEHVDFLSGDERRALERLDIRDTRALLGWTAPLARRVWLARQTGIELERLEALARTCDLLRIDGIGPSIAEILILAGVSDSRALARERPSSLLERLRVASRGTSMRNRMPAQDTVASWIRDARRLRPILDGVPRAP